MALAPDAAALQQWMGVKDPQPDVMARMIESVAAARGMIETRCTVPATYPDAMRTAVLITAHRLYTRKDSPDGVASFGELGAVNVSTFDGDVEKLISPYLSMDGFA